jgi:sugar phosphate isomerase/epimerase
MRIGIVTDEISPDIREAISLGVSWGIRDFEFRTSQSGRVPYISDEDLQELLTCQKEFGVKITALSPGLFKIPLEDEAAIKKDLDEVLQSTIQLAHKFHTDLIITFGFLRSVSASSLEFDRAVEVLRKAADHAEKEGITLALENEPGFWADSGKKTAKLLAAVNSKSLRANWDPANALGAENFPFPAGYEALKPWVVNIHVKDAKKEATLACVPVGEGRVNWEGQLRALVKDGRLRHVTIETHCLPLIEKSKQNVETVGRLLKKIQEEHSRETRVS